jgi:prepilin-type N-terminal cleavage/methylation domain-containing protein
MNKRTKQSGFSLTEVLLAVGVMAVGMVVVASIFPAALYFATLSTEKTIASAVADEAFAKIRMYDVSIYDNNESPYDVWDSDDDNTCDGDYCIPYRIVGVGIVNDNINEDEYPLRAYWMPSPTDPDKRLLSEYVYPTDANSITGKDYTWSALCRHIDGTSLQITVFVNRRVGSRSNYRWWEWDETITTKGTVVDTGAPLPEAVKVEIDAGYGELNEIQIVNERQFFSRGSKIVDDETGIIYEVQERYKGGNDNIIRLDKNWQGGSDYVWVVPPPSSGGRKPCVGVYQRIIKF